MSVDEFIYAVVLGLVQGVTEFLPVSSSGHLIIVSYFFDGRVLPIALNIALHMGTVAAVLLYFAKDWLKLGQDVLLAVRSRESNHGTSVLLPALVIGSLPAGVIGILWQDEIEAWLHHPLATILPLAFVGWLLWVVDKKMPTTKSSQSLSWKDALIVGFCQACALIPGTSRSGATIIGGRLVGLDRVEAARFSFMLGTPAMAGAALLNAKELMHSLDDPVFYLGFLTSVLTGCLAIGFLLQFIKRHDFFWFFIYRVALALLLLIQFRESVGFG